MVVRDRPETGETGLASLGPGYRELAPPAHLGAFLECLWVREYPEPDQHSRVVPDGCIDIVWMGASDVLVAGPATRPIIADLTAGSNVAGIRFRPGVAPAVLGVYADELLDVHLPLRTIWSRDSRQLEERGGGLVDVRTKLLLLQEMLTSRLPDAYAPDDLVSAGIALMHRDASLSARDIGGYLGLSERQLLRRFRQAVGFGPRTMGRIIRFQSTLELLAIRSLSVSLAGVAQISNYADQAHMTREFVQLAGMTPARLIKTSRQQKSDSFNTNTLQRP